MLKSFPTMSQIAAGKTATIATVDEPKGWGLLRGVTLGSDGGLLLGTLSRAEAADGDVRMPTIGVAMLDGTGAGTGASSVTACFAASAGQRFSFGPIGGGRAGATTLSGEPASAASFVAGLSPHGQRIVPDSVFVFAE